MWKIIRGGASHLKENKIRVKKFTFLYNELYFFKEITPGLHILTTSTATSKDSSAPCVSEIGGHGTENRSIVIRARADDTMKHIVSYHVISVTSTFVIVINIFIVI